jgi:hypothetical protein
LKHDDALFLGKVTAQDSETLVYHITALENFAGDQRVGQDVLIAGEGECGYHFEIGETYLVDAYWYKGIRATSLCNLTAPASASTTMLRELRALATGGRLPDLSGIVGVPDGGPWDYRPPVRPLSSIPITITSDNGTPRKTVTDSDGVYTFPILPPGKYTVEATLPSEFTTRESVNKKPLQIEMPNANGIGAACRQDITVLPSGSISVLVLDESGIPIPGEVWVGPALNWRRGNKFRGARGDRQPDGSFTVHFLAEGSYLIEFIRDGAYTSKWFYPRTQVEADAETINLKNGQHIEGLRFVLPLSVATPPK